MLGGREGTEGEGGNKGGLWDRMQTERKGHIPVLHGDVVNNEHGSTQSAVWATRNNEGLCGLSLCGRLCPEGSGEGVTDLSKVLSQMQKDC